MPRISLASVVLGLVATAALAPSPGLAQGAALTIEGRGGGALPAGAFAEGGGVGEGVSGGAIFGFEVTLRSTGRRAWYAGFAQARFGCEDAGCPAGERYVATGVNAGVRVSLLRTGPVLPWIAVGGVTTRVESPGVRGSRGGVSSLGYGVEAGAGLFVRAGTGLAFTPGVRYTQAGTDLPGGVPLTLRYFAVDLGLAFTFG